jgi:hypothetical protein
MSKQADQEKQQAESLTSSEGHQSLLTEQEVSQQELVELDGEQLMEVAGGVLPTREQVTTALKHVGIAVCCVASVGTGAGLGSATNQLLHPDSNSAAGLGAAVGAGAGAVLVGVGAAGLKCIDCYYNRRRSQASAQVRPVGDVELGHAQHHG